MDQKQELSVPPVLLSQIGVLYRTVRKTAGSLFRKQDFPLDVDQIPVLLVLYYTNGACQQAMGASLQRDNASINRTVAFLVKNGYATVEPDPENGRKTIVKTTAEGTKFARQADRIISQYNNALSSALSSEEQQLLHTLINKLIEAQSSTPLPFSF